MWNHEGLTLMQVNSGHALIILFSSTYSFARSLLYHHGYSKFGSGPGGNYIVLC